MKYVATLRYATVRYTTLYCATLRYAMLRYATLYYAMLCYTMLRYAMLRYAMISAITIIHRHRECSKLRCRTTTDGEFPSAFDRLSAGDPLSGGLGGGGVDGAITSAGGAALAADRRALPILPGTRLARSPRCSSAIRSTIAKDVVLIIQPAIPGCV